MSTVLHVRPTDTFVADILRAAFPEYGGKRVRVRVAESVRFAGTQWDSGRRTVYRLLRLADMTLAAIPQEEFMQLSSLHHNDFAIPEGFVVVAHHQGAFEYVEIIAGGENIIQALPAPDELSEDEQIVLMATAGLKSSYGGIPNFRFREASRRTGITLDRWENAKVAMIGRKLLNKAGAITPEGRNAIGSKRLF